MTPLQQAADDIADVEVKWAIARLNRLVPRELDVLVLAGGGMTRGEVAIQLGISPQAVTVAKTRALIRLNRATRRLGGVRRHRWPRKGKLEP